jgi:hypothetical protein
MTIVEERPAITGGVDTHSEVHVAAALGPMGRLLGTREFPATAAGYAGLLGWLGVFGDVVLVGVEGTGSYGAGLARYLGKRGIRVVEVDRADRRPRRPLRCPAWPARAQAPRPVRLDYQHHQSGRSALAGTRHPASPAAQRAGSHALANPAEAVAPRPLVADSSLVACSP